MGPIWYIDYDCCTMKEGTLNFGTEIGFFVVLKHSSSHPCPLELDPAKELSLSCIYISGDSLFPRFALV